MVTVFPHIVAAATILFWIHLVRKLFKFSFPLCNENLNSFLTRWGNYLRRRNYSREETIWGNAVYIYTVLNLTDLRIKMDSKRIPLYPFFKIVVSLLSEIEKKEKICGHFHFPPFKIRLDQGSSKMSRLSSIWGWVCENRLWSCKFCKIETLW